MAKNEQLSAYVMMKPRHPRELTPDHLTAERIGELEFDRRDVERVRKFFRSEGFEVTKFDVVGFSITASRVTFEKLFGPIEIRSGSTGPVVVTGEDDEGLDLRRLPVLIRRRVLSVSFSRIDFGPGEFFP